MKRTALILSLVLAALVAGNVLAQRYSCADMEWPDQIDSIYENVERACEEILEIDGVRYGRFEATFLSEHAGEVTLRFPMPEGNSVVQTFRPPDDFRVRVDDKRMAFHELERGQAVTLLIPER
mgnify:CR=1 FL=1